MMAVRALQIPARARRLALMLVPLAALLALSAACGSGTTDADQANVDQANAEPTAAESTVAVSSQESGPTTSPTTRAEIVRFSDLDTIGLGELPAEALDTLRLIRDDGPYPYDQDGSTFQNREGILPDKDRGHYREFTVDTPGLSHRGARRIVAGNDDALYYTDDHYSSFREIVAEESTS